MFEVFAAKIMKHSLFVGAEFGGACLTDRDMLGSIFEIIPQTVLALEGFLLWL